MRIGIICPSEIAIRRFMPALVQCNEFTFMGLGVFSKEERFGCEEISEESVHKIRKAEIEKAQVFINKYGGRLYNSYTEIVTSSEIDAVYIPLPPALHYKWAKKALENGKHVLVEKPLTTNYNDTTDLIDIARKKKLGLHENYMFVFHNQLTAIEHIIENGDIGEVRLYRISFGFPQREANDFRYNKTLGGGALLDAGGYTIKYASMLLGKTAKLKCAQSNYSENFEVDLYGSATLVNDSGVTAQISFGMDNNYKCELEVWGSLGTLKTGRILTAPTGYIPTAVLKKGNEEKTIELPDDDSFKKSIRWFDSCTKKEKIREENYGQILRQANLVDEFKFLAGWKK